MSEFDAKEYCSDASVERIHAKFSPQYSALAISGLCMVNEDAVNEVLLYKELAGGTIVDVTPGHLGRNPHKLARVARQTRVMCAACALPHGPVD